MNGGSNGLYRVTQSQALLQRVRGWRDAARAKGVLPEFAAAVRRIWRRLAVDPLRWGDPSYRLPNLGLQMFRAATWGILIHYGVDEARRIVYLTELQLLSGHPLEPES